MSKNNNNFLMEKEKGITKKKLHIVKAPEETPNLNITY